MRNRHPALGRQLHWLTVALLLTAPPRAFAQQPRPLPLPLSLPTLGQANDPRRPYPALPNTSVYPVDARSAIGARIAAAPRDLSEPIMLDEEYPPYAQPAQPDGILQYLHFTSTWLPALGGGDLGMSDLELGATLGFPMPTRESPLLISPYFATHYLDGPAGPDLPPRVFDASVQFRWLRPVSERWTADLAVTPGVHSDFESSDSDMFRITGRAIGIFQWTEATQLILGVVYLDRFDVSLIPAAGFIWTPSDDWRFELVAPRPRIARRILPCFGNECDEYWAYVAGEFGGGSWSIQRASGAHDEVAVRDYRILLGVERKSPRSAGRLKGRFEVGVVFGRTLEYRSATPDFEPDPTLVVRFGVSR